MQDAQAAMCLYSKYQEAWERDIGLGVAEAPKKKGRKKSLSTNVLNNSGLQVLGQNRVASSGPEVNRITSIGGQRFLMSNSQRLSRSNNFATVGAFNTPEMF